MGMSRGEWGPMGVCLGGAGGGYVRRARGGLSTM